MNTFVGAEKFDLFEKFELNTNWCCRTFNLQLRRKITEHQFLRNHLMFIVVEIRKLGNRFSSRFVIYCHAVTATKQQQDGFKIKSKRKKKCDESKTLTCLIDVCIISQAQNGNLLCSSRSSRTFMHFNDAHTKFMSASRIWKWLGVCREWFILQKPKASWRENASVNSKRAVEILLKTRCGFLIEL